MAPKNAGKPVHDGHWRDDGPRDFKGSEADIGHAIFRQGAGLELGIHDLQDGNAGRHGGGGPTPAKDAALNPALTKELGREPQQEEHTEDGAEDKEEKKRLPVGSNGGRERWRPRRRQ